jgi:hypothetical protein
MSGRRVLKSGSGFAKGLELGLERLHAIGLISRLTGRRPETLVDAFIEALDPRLDSRDLSKNRLLNRRALDGERPVYSLDGVDHEPRRLSLAEPVRSKRTKQHALGADSQTAQFCGNGQAGFWSEKILGLLQEVRSGEPGGRFSLRASLRRGTRG